MFSQKKPLTYGIRSKYFIFMQSQRENVGAHKNLVWIKYDFLSAFILIPLWISHDHLIPLDNVQNFILKLLQKNMIGIQKLAPAIFF